MPFPIIPIIAGIAAIASAAIASRSSKKQAEKTANANMELAKYQEQANTENIAEQNKYNTPAMQMARYQDAGLNPNLIYGQGNSGNQAQAAHYEAPRVDYHFNPLQLPDVVSPFLDMAMKKAQIDNVQAATESTKTEIGNKLLERLLTQTNTARRDFDLSQAKQLAPYNLDIRRQQNNQAHQKVMMNLQQIMHRDQMLPLIEQGQRSRNTLIDTQSLFNTYRNQWMKMGVTTSDHPLIRWISRAMATTNFDGIDLNEDKIYRDLHLK